MLCKTLLIEFLFAIIVDFVILIELIRFSSSFKNVWSPEAPIHVALRPCLDPTLGIGPGKLYQGVLGLLYREVELCSGCTVSCEKSLDILPSCPFYKN